MSHFEAKFTPEQAEASRIAKEIESHLRQPLLDEGILADWKRLVELEADEYPESKTDYGPLVLKLIDEVRRLRAHPPMRVPAGVKLGPQSLEPGAVITVVDDVRAARRAERERACKALEAVAGTAPAVLSLDKAGNETFSHGWNSAIADATAVIRTLPDEE